MTIIKESSSNFEDSGAILILTCEKCGKKLTIVNNCVTPCPCGKKDKKEEKK